MKSLRKKPILLLILGILVLLLFIAVMGVDLAKLLDLFYSSDKRFFALAYVFDIGFMFFYALAWYYLVKIIEDKITYRDAVIATLMGWFSDMLVPAAFIAGEVVRLYYLKRKYNVEISKAMATVLIHRVLSAFAFVFFILLGLIYIIIGRRSLSTDVIIQALLFAFLTGIVMFIGLTIIVRVELFEKWSIKIFDKLCKYLKRLRLERYRKYVEEWIVSFKRSVLLIRAKKLNIVIGFIFLIIQWTCGILIPYSFFLAVKSPVSFWILALAYPMYGVIDNIPLAIPGNAGLLDVAMISTFILLGISRETAIAVTLLVRMVIVLFEALFTGTVTMIYAPEIFEGFNLKEFREKIFYLKRMIEETEPSQ